MLKIIIILVILLLIVFSKRRESFDIGYNLTHLPLVGHFDECYQIGTNYRSSIKRCKQLCNKLDSCKGISYRGCPHYECKLYNSTHRTIKNPQYMSWRNFWNKIY